MLQFDAATYLKFYATERILLVRQAYDITKRLSSYRRKLKTTTETQLLQSYQQYVTDLTSDLRLVRQSLINLYKQKVIAESVIKSSIPPVPLLNPRPHAGTQGPTGPTGPTITRPIDNQPQIGSENLVSSGGVYNKCLDNVAGVKTSVLLGAYSEGDSSVVLLCHFNVDPYSDYSLVDSGYYNFKYPALKLYNMAHLSTNACKFGTSSLRCLTQYDRLILDTAGLPIIGTDNFTVELWVNFQLFRSTEHYILGIGSQVSLSVTANGTGVTVSICNVSETWSYAFTTNTWYNFTVVRSLGTTSVYVNGSLVGSNSQMSGYIPQSVIVVASSVKNVTHYTTGYIDELRISVGVARYTQNFACQTNEFPNALVSSLPTVSVGQVMTDGKQVLFYSSTGWKTAVIESFE